METFATRLRTVREKRGLSQRELARRCTLSINQINRYENGVIEPSISALQAIVRELKVSADYLLGFTAEAHALSTSDEVNNEETKLLEAFRQEGWPGVIRLGGERLTK